MGLFSLSGEHGPFLPKPLQIFECSISIGFDFGWSNTNPARYNAFLYRICQYIFPSLTTDHQHKSCAGCESRGRIQSGVPMLAGVGMSL